MYSPTGPITLPIAESSVTNLVSDLAAKMPMAAQSTTLTGSQNDFALTAGVSVLRCNNASLLTLTGFVAGVPGQLLAVLSVGAGQVNFAPQNAGSSAANRLANFCTGTNTSLAAGVGSALYIYDGTAQRWRLLQHEQGGWINVPYAAGDYTGGGGMTWTVDLGDMRTFAYLLVGRSLKVAAYLDTTTVSGGQVQLFVAIPAGFVANTVIQSSAAGFDNGVGTTTYNRVGAVGFTLIEVGRADVANWAVSTNNTFIRVNIEFPIT